MGYQVWLIAPSQVLRATRECFWTLRVITLTTREAKRQITPHHWHPKPVLHTAAAQSQWQCYSHYRSSNLIMRFGISRTAWQGSNRGMCWMLRTMYMNPQYFVQNSKYKTKHHCFLVHIWWNKYGRNLKTEGELDKIYRVFPATYGAMFYNNEVSRDFSACLSPLWILRCMNSRERFVQQFL